MAGFNWPVTNGQYLTVTTACSNGDQIGINTYFFRAITSGAATIDGVAEAWDADTATAYKAWLSSDSLYYGSKWSSMNGPPFPLPYVANSNSGSGIAGGVALPAQVSGVVTRLVGLIGRANRGRVYIPFPASTSALDAFLLNGVGTFKLNAVASQTLFIYTAGDVTINPFLFHSGGIPNSSITGFTVRPRLATQRRRGAYGRPNAFPPF